MSTKATPINSKSPFFEKKIATLTIFNSKGGCSVSLTQEGSQILSQIKNNDPYVHGQLALFLDQTSPSDSSDETIEQEAIAFFRTRSNQEFANKNSHLFIEKNPNLPVGDYSLVAAYFFPPLTRPAEAARISQKNSRFKQ